MTQKSVISEGSWEWEASKCQKEHERYFTRAQIMDVYIDILVTCPQFFNSTSADKKQNKKKQQTTWLWVPFEILFVRSQLQAPGPYFCCFAFAKQSIQAISLLPVCSVTIQACVKYKIYLLPRSFISIIYNMRGEEVRRRGEQRKRYATTRNDDSTMSLNENSKQDNCVHSNCSTQLIIGVLKGQNEEWWLSSDEQEGVGNDVVIIDSTQRKCKLMQRMVRGRREPRG